MLLDRVETAAKHGRRDPLTFARLTILLLLAFARVQPEPSWPFFLRASRNILSLQFLSSRISPLPWPHNFLYFVRGRQSWAVHAVQEEKFEPPLNMSFSLFPPSLPTPPRTRPFFLFLTFPNANFILCFRPTHSDALSRLFLPQLDESLSTLMPARQTLLLWPARKTFCFSWENFKFFPAFPSSVYSEAPLLDFVSHPQELSQISHSEK